MAGTVTISEGESRRSPKRALLRGLQDLFDPRTRGKLALATVGSLVIALADSAAVVLVLPLADLTTGGGSESTAVRVVSRILGDPDESTLTVVLAVSVVALFIVKNLGSLVFQWWLQGFVMLERVKTSAALLRHFLTTPYTVISQRSSAELMRTMDAAVVQVFGSALYGVMQTVSFSLTILTMVTVLLVVAPLPTVALTCYFGLAAVLYMYVVKPRATAAGELTQQASLEGLRTAFAALGAIKELSLRGTQDHFVTNYQRAQTKGARAGRVTAVLGGLPRYILEILFVLAIGIVVLVSTMTPSGAGSSIAGVLTLFVAAGFRILPSVTGLLASLSSIKVGARALELVHAELVASRITKRPSRQDAPPLPFRRMLSLQAVHFTYPTSTQLVLKDIGLQIRKGSSVAVVGGSGAGKTTLVDLILGLHDPTAGHITVDGIDIATNMAGWQKNVGYVPQDVYLLDATMSENVAFDLEPERVDKHRLHRAIAGAHLQELVDELPAGLDTPLGERGTRLSGGQRQRVGIARALYREPDLLVLDEATSALDNETEHKITQAIAALHGEVTVLIVAHRLSTVRQCDQVLFLSEGRIEARGTFEEVQRLSPQFSHLVRLGTLVTPASGLVHNQAAPTDSGLTDG